MTSGAYGSTTGTDTRGPRPLMKGLMVFGIRDEIDALRDEAPYVEGDRNSLTLAKDVDFRVLLTVLRPGAELDEQDGDARASLHLIEGSAVLTMDSQEAELGQAEIAIIDAGRPWRLRAASDCALLLTLAWPRDKAGV